eukprot:TRINITY_DN9831_c0_g1_i3.p1 TRINITY_DN9831_c0_g1~~TRINITY_DN9831_c0_g1_i3.p1  ORF type:complete len:269 (-),score=69.20 TRINITY_DN9831_c0_g1_i3:74-847(-)
MEKARLLLLGQAGAGYRSVATTAVDAPPAPAAPREEEGEGEGDGEGEECLKEYDGRATEAEARAREALAAARACTAGPDREMKIPEAIEAVRSMERAVTLFKVEMRTRPDVRWEQTKWKEKFDGHTTALEALKAESTCLEKELLTGNLENMSADQVLEKAEDIQLDTLRIAKEIDNKLDSTVQIAVDTLAEMDQQTVILVTAKTTTEEMKQDLQLAGKQVGIFTRRMMTDKVILLGIAAVVAIVTAIVIYVCVVPKS